MLGSGGLLIILATSAYWQVVVGAGQSSKILWCCNNCPRENCPRRQLSKGLLSNDTVVQADFCPRKRLLVKSLLKLIFLFSIETYHTCVLYSERKNNMSSFHFVKLTPWTKVTLDKRLLGQLCHWTKVPWTTVTLDNRPLDNCCNTQPTPSDIHLKSHIYIEKAK